MKDGSELQHAWYSQIPVELHGHRKKLDFFVVELERFARARDRAQGDISILEIGCSNGRNVSLPLAERGYDVTGVDLHQPSIEWATAHNSFGNARFICRDAGDFRSERTFDVVVLSDILEHVEDPLQLLMLAGSLINDGGMVLVCIPNGFGLGEIERKLVEVTRFNSVLQALRAGINRLRRRQSVPYNEDSGHIQYFRMSTISALIQRAGFKIENKGKGALLGGGITYPFGMFFPGLSRATLKIADYLPFWAISTWYFRLVRANGISPDVS